MKLDLSIGQRLAAGFTLMLAILAGVLFTVSQAHQASAGAQAAYMRHIAPLAERASALEQSLYRIAITIRNYLLDPREANLAAYRTAVEGVRTALYALHEAPKYEVSRALYQDLAALVAAYLLEAEQAIEMQRNGVLREDEGPALSGARARSRRDPRVPRLPG